MQNDFTFPNVLMVTRKKILMNLEARNRLIHSL